MLKIKESEKFAKDIETMVKDKHYTYIEAVVEYARANNLEFESVAKILTPKLKQKIQNEATDLNLLGKKPVKLKF